jgi:hypothetical protein
MRECRVTERIKEKAVWATITSVGFAVAQNILQTSGTILIEFKTLMR